MNIYRIEDCDDPKLIAASSFKEAVEIMIKLVHAENSGETDFEYGEEEITSVILLGEVFNTNSTKADQAE